MKAQVDPNTGNAVPPAPTPSQVPARASSAEQGFASQIVERKAETSITAAAAQAKAEVEAAYVMALHRPRNIMDVREKILDACKRQAFAQGAKYSKPIGGGFVTGPSIRFAEEALRAFGNVRVSCPTIFEDAECRVVRITVTDLESNLHYSQEVTLQKTVERRSPRAGQEILGERQNSTGQKVYIVRATEDDFAVKLAAATSKVIRNHGLRLIPSDIVEEAMQAVDKAANGQGFDPAAERKKIADAFHGLNIPVKELERYLGHGLDVTTPSELRELRQLFEALRDGETNWGAVMESRSTERRETGNGNGHKPDAPPAPPAKAPEKADDLREEIVSLVDSIDNFDVTDPCLQETGFKNQTEINTCEDAAKLSKLRDSLRRAGSEAKKKVSRK